LRDSLGEFGLARSGWSFEKNRLAERIAQEHDCGEFVINEIARSSKSIARIIYRGEVGHRNSSHDE
jgi:hypothetical protein